MTGSKSKDLFYIEQICTDFETDWSTDSISLIVDLVLKAESRLQPELVEELVSIDMEMRRSKNEAVNTDQYLSRLPGFSKSINEIVEGGSENSTDANDHVDSTPRRIGDYRIVQLIGKGGSGIVYEGIQESLGRRVAIKTMSQGHLHSQAARFRREAKAIALLHHTNIVKVFGTGVHKGSPYFAMQLVEGQNLADLIEAARNGTSGNGKSPMVGPDAQQEVARIGLQVAKALEHAHQNGVLHRDIKPSNLILDKNDRTWVTDFGLAKLVDESMHAKTVGLVGTIRYVPPEGFSGEWNEQSDIYSLGLTLFELLALKPAMEGEDYRKLIKEISSDRSPLVQFPKIDGVSRDLETIILKASSRDRARRYSSAGELADELQCFIDGKPIKARPVSFLEKSLLWAKRQPAAAALVSLVVLVAFVGLPVLLWLWLQANSALTTVQLQREKEKSLQQSIVESQVDAEAAKYSSTSLLTQSFIDRGDGTEARRTFGELRSSLSTDQGEDSLPWELKYFNQSLDVSEMTLHGNPEHEVWRIAIRPDNMQVATVHSDPNNPETKSEVILWDAKTWTKMHVLRSHGSVVFGCSYSNDGKKLATVGLNMEQFGNPGILNMWDVETGKRTGSRVLKGVFNKRLLDGFYGHPVLPGVTFSNDNNQIVTWPLPLQVRDTESQRVLWECDDGRCAVTLDDDRLLVYTGTVIQIRDISSGKILGKCEGRDMLNLNNFQLSPDGKKFSCTGRDKMLVWNSVDALSEFIDLRIPGISWGMLSPDSTQVIYSSRMGGLGVESLDRRDSNSVRTLLGHEGMVTHGSFSHNGKWFVTAGKDSTAKIWPIEPKRCVVETNLFHERISNICFSQDGEKVHYAARRVPRGRYIHNAGSVSMESGAVSMKTIESTYQAHWPRGDFSFSPDGKFLAAPVSEPDVPDEFGGFALTNEIGIWECDSWEKRGSVKTQLSAVCSVKFSQNNKRMIVAGVADDRNLIQLFDIVSGKEQKIGELEFENPIVAVDLTQSKLAASTEDGQVSVWSFTRRTGTNDDRQMGFEKKFEASIGGRLVCLNFSPDGNHLALADHQSDNLVMLNAETGETKYQKAGPRAFCCVKFSPCGKRLALSGYDSIVHLCNAESGYRLLTLPGSDSFPGTIAINSRVVFSSDGRKIATNTWQGRIRFWTLDSRTD